MVRGWFATLALAAAGAATRYAAVGPFERAARSRRTGRDPSQGGVEERDRWRAAAARTGR